MSPARDDRPLEADPTGMRDLLATLPDPGPMPDDLVARIRASLAQEARALEARAGGDTSASGESPPAVPHPPRAHGIVDLDHVRARRRPPRLLPWAAAAGLVVVAGGAFVATGGIGGLSAALHSGDTSTTVAGSALAGATAVASDAQRAAAAIAPTVVLNSSATWTAPDLPSAARTALAGASDAATAPDAALGRLATADGARACAGALGISSLDRVVVDLGTYAGAPAALVVAESASGGRTAYVVGRGCRPGAPDLVHGALGF